jgi:type IV pilus assembly protein PilO
MNELLDRLFELPPRQRLLLLAGSVGVLLFAYMYFLYWPRSEQITQLEQQRDQVRLDRDRKAKMLANLDETRKQVADLEAELKMAVAQLPDTKEIPDLLSTVSSLGRESGLEIIQFKQRPEQYEEFYAVVPVDIAVRGTYNQIASFLDSVGQMARIVNVTDVHMKSPPKLEGAVVPLDTSAVAVTFRFLDEAERERIAKQKEKEKGAKP